EVILPIQHSPSLSILITDLITSVLSLGLLLGTTVRLAVRLDGHILPNRGVEGKLGGYFPLSCPPATDCSATHRMRHPTAHSSQATLPAISPTELEPFHEAIPARESFTRSTSSETTVSVL